MNHENGNIVQILEQRQWIEAHAQKPVVSEVPPMDGPTIPPSPITYKGWKNTTGTPEEKIARLGIKVPQAKVPGRGGDLN